MIESVRDFVDRIARTSTPKLVAYSLVGAVVFVLLLLPLLWVLRA